MAVNAFQTFLFFKRPKLELPNHAVLHEIWTGLQESYFPERSDLGDYRVRWSHRRQTMSLASCNVHTFRVSVAAALSLQEYRWVLTPLLYHEMCHAVLGKPPIVRGRRVVHGREFKTLERRHPQIPLMDQWIRTGGWNLAVKQYRRLTG